MAEEEGLSLSNDDIDNMKIVVNDLIDIVAKFSGPTEVTEVDFSELKAVLDFAQFVVSGVIYSNGLDICAGHGHDDEEDDDDSAV